MVFQYVYSSVMLFNNGLQGPPGITGMKGEVSMPLKHSFKAYCTVEEQTKI